MDNQTLQAISDTSRKHDKVAIVVGKNPTLDEMGAALSLYLGFTDQNKQVTIACPTDPLVEISTLVGIDKVKRQLDGDGGDFTVSFPYRERETDQGELEPEIQKVSYTLENGFLNIIVKSGQDGLSFGEKDVQYRHSGDVPSLLFVIGTPRLSDLGNLFNVEALKDTTIINIDNKQENQGFGEIVFVSPRYSSVCEQVLQVLHELQIAIDVDIAQNLLSGISFATNNFADQKTSPTAFEAAAFLMKKGAIRSSFVQPKVAPDAFFGPPAPQQRSLDTRAQRDARPFPQRPAPPSLGGQAGQFGQRQQGAFRGQKQQPSYQQQVNSISNRPPMEEQKVQRPLPGSGRNPALPRQPQQNQKSQQQEDEAPSDWLTPKVYKGSTLV